MEIPIIEKSFGHGIDPNQAILTQKNIERLEKQATIENLKRLLGGGKWKPDQVWNIN